jgi:hypothetical protein
MKVQKRQGYWIVRDLSSLFVTVTVEEYWIHFMNFHQKQ